MEWISKTPAERKKAKVPNGRWVTNQRFTLATRFLAPLAPLIQKGFASSAKRKTPMGRAMSHVMLSAMEGEYPDQRVNPAKVLLSMGSLPNLFGTSLVRENDRLRVTWIWDSQRLVDRYSQLHWDDEVILCAYNPDIRMAGINDEVALRESGEVILTLPFELSAVEVEVYLLVRSRDHKRYSKSVYLGRV